MHALVQHGMHEPLHHRWGLFSCSGRPHTAGAGAVLCYAAGVMLFCLGRDECPVDTHVWEISKQVCVAGPVGVGVALGVV
jgi:hypothetical protein